MLEYLKSRVWVLTDSGRWGTVGFDARWVLAEKERVEVGGLERLNTWLTCAFRRTVLHMNVPANTLHMNALANTLFEPVTEMRNTEPCATDDASLRRAEQ